MLKMLTRPGRLAILAFAAGAALVAAPSALADSSTIAGAPMVVPGQQTFGNSTGDTQFAVDMVASYWGLPVTAGDRVVVSYDGDAAQAGSLSVYAEPIGTADGLGFYDLVTGSVASAESGARGTVRFIAPKTGVMPLAFIMSADSAGPYDFTVTVQHRVDPQLPLVKTIPARGKLSVGAHDPDGHPLTAVGLMLRLQARVSPGHWRSIGQASPTNGVATIHYVVPKRLQGHVVHIRVHASGGGYFTRNTASQAFRVRPAVRPRHRGRHHGGRR